jgi:hypothetical protein
MVDRDEAAAGDVDGGTLLLDGDGVSSRTTLAEEMRRAVQACVSERMLPVIEQARLALCGRCVRKGSRAVLRTR